MGLTHIEPVAYHHGTCNCYLRPERYINHKSAHPREKLELVLICYKIKYYIKLKSSIFKQHKLVVEKQNTRSIPLEAGKWRERKWLESYMKNHIIRNIPQLKEYSRRNSRIYLNMNRVHLNKFSCNNCEYLRVRWWWWWRKWRMMGGRRDFVMQISKKHDVYNRNIKCCSRNQKRVNRTYFSIQHQKRHGAPVPAYSPSMCTPMI